MTDTSAQMFNDFIASLSESISQSNWTGDEVTADVLYHVRQAAETALSNAQERAGNNGR